MLKEFRYRIENGQVILFDKIHATTTLGRDDETFGYSIIEYNKDFEKFNISGQKEIVRIENSTELSLNENLNRLDVIHHSTLPWIKFTGITHARNFKMNHSVPIIILANTLLLMKNKL